MLILDLIFMKQFIHHYGYYILTMYTLAPVNNKNYDREKKERELTCKSQTYVHKHDQKSNILKLFSYVRLNTK